jgi:hypothetical protein
LDEEGEELYGGEKGVKGSRVLPFFKREGIKCMRNRGCSFLGDE